MNSFELLSSPEMMMVNGGGSPAESIYWGQNYPVTGHKAGIYWMHFLGRLAGKFSKSAEKWFYDHDGSCK